VLSDDKRSPGAFGFEDWLSVTNFFDINPLLSHCGKFREFTGDSSEIVVAEALEFIRNSHRIKQSFLAVLWFGTPHSPWLASQEDRKDFSGLSLSEQNHYGELIAMDRSIGWLRSELRKLGVAENTLIWFCSDNGGLERFGPATVKGLRGWKNTLWEGGLRVPAIIEWPKGISRPRVTSFPAVTMDILPTLVEIAGLSESVLPQPQDGMSLKGLLSREIGLRRKPIPFRHMGRAALIDNDYKLITEDLERGHFELYNLVADPVESNDLYSIEKEVAQQMSKRLLRWNQGVERSIAGEDYPGGRLMEPDPDPVFWMELPVYKPYFEEWSKRPEYKSHLVQSQN
jgi:arylsulfatase A-like enzyme